MTRSKLAIFLLATVVVVLAVTETELLFPSSVSPAVRACVLVVAFVLWMTGTAVYLNSDRHSAWGCLLLNVEALIFVCAMVLSILGRAEWATSASLYSASLLPLLLMRSHHVFRTGAARSSNAEVVAGILTIGLVAFITARFALGIDLVVTSRTVAVVVAAGLALAMVMLFILWHQERDPKVRQQILHVMVGSVVQFLVFFALYSASSLQGLLWLWVLSTVILPLTVCVSVLRGSFIDVKVHRNFVYLLLTLVLFGGYVMGIRLALHYLIGGGAKGLVAMVIVCVMSLAFIPLVRLTLRFVDYVGYRDHYSLRALLSRVFDGLPLRLTSEVLGRHVCVHLTEALNLEWCMLISSLSGAPRMIASAGPAPRYVRLGADEAEVVGVIHVPLEINGRTIGEIVVAMRGSHKQLRSIDEDMLKTVAQQTAMMLENLKLVDTLGDRVQSLQKAEAGRQIMHRRLTESEEATRATLSRELHDGPVQSLLHLVRMCEMDAGEQPTQQQLGRVADLGRDIAFELRQVCSDLRPHVLDHLDLPAALEGLVRRYSHQYEVLLTLDVEEQTGGDHRRLDKHVEVTLYRVIDEAIVNVLRHSDASHANVSLSYSANCVELTVRDNGIGFSVEEDDLLVLSETSHIGIIGMFERIRDLNGRIRISRGASGGTELVASVTS
jgi:signal transduction histidine kinase